MGRVFSTRWREQTARTTTDQALPLDVRELARHGTLTPSWQVISWTHGGRAWRVAVRVDGDSLVLNYAVEGN